MVFNSQNLFNENGGSIISREICGVVKQEVGVGDFPGARGSLTP
jgi:hypothetical protein